MDGPPRIVAFYIPSFERGGVERLVINLSRELVSRDIEVDVLVRETDPPIEQLDERVSMIHLDSARALDRLVHSLFPPHVSNAILSLPAYVRYLRERSPDLVISMQTSPFAVLGVELSQVDTTLVIRESNTPSAATSDSDHVIGRFASIAKRLSYPRADSVIAVSQDAADDIAQHIGVDVEDISAIYNPTYNDRVIDRSKEPVEHPWFDEEVSVITSVGRFSDQKDFATLLRAFAQVHSDDGREVRLVLVGDGANMNQLETFAAELGIEERVAFVGYQQNPYPYMAKADIFVLSSFYEGLPNVLIEAIGVGTPVISTDCPSGPREILLDGAGGTLVPIGDTDAMANAIRQYLDDPDVAAEKLELAREHLSRFTPERAADEYLSLIE